jgi:hypothetical protein
VDFLILAIFEVVLWGLRVGNGVRKFSCNMAKAAAMPTLLRIRIFCAGCSARKIVFINTEKKIEIHFQEESMLSRNLAWIH